MKALNGALRISGVMGLRRYQFRLDSVERFPCAAAERVSEKRL